MGRKESKAWVCIHSICAAHHIDEENLCKRAKLLLSSFSNLYWSRVPGNRWGEKPMTYEDRIRLKEAFNYLKEFPATEEKQTFLIRITTYMDVGLLQEMVNHALLRVAEFPDFGKTHFDILSKCYLSSVDYQEDEILFELHLERSRYYDRKKEAVMLFGIAFWTVAIRNYEELLVPAHIA